MKPCAWFSVVVFVLVSQGAWAGGTIEQPTGTARGVVFHDRNANGVRDQGEPGVAGVRVSNGVDVVRTDDAGAYALPVSDDCMVFVCKPRGWMTRVDELNLPRFYYIHKPNGSPDEKFLYKGVKPTGPLPASIDFPLTKQDEDRPFKFLAVGDPQPYTLQEVEYYGRDVIAEARHVPAAFAIMLGDLVGDDLDLYEPYNQTNAKLGMPVYNVHGNHDINFTSPNDQHSDETFERVFGPGTHAFQWGQTHFILVDNIIWKGFEGLNNRGKERNNNYTGGLRPDQLAFIENYLRDVPKNEPVIVCMHAPLVHEQLQHSVPQTPELMRLLSGRERTLSLSGHTHLNQHYFLGSDTGYAGPGASEHHHHNVGTASGQWWKGVPDERGIPHATMQDGTPNGYAVYSFTDQGYTHRYKAARRDAAEQVAIHLPDRVTREALASLALAANVYDGSERSRVEFRVAGGPWKPMTQALENDPGYEAMFAADQALGDSVSRRKLGEPKLCRHLWKAPLDAGTLGEGLHLVEVRTRDMHGAEHLAVRPLRVTGP